MAPKTKIKIIQRLLGCSLHKAKQLYRSGNRAVLKLSIERGSTWEIEAEDYFTAAAEDGGS
jgi:hypothetical protein